MMRSVYAGAICEGNGTYGIVFPDFPGCISAADTMEAIVARGHEALQFHIEGMVEDGEIIPEPRPWTLAEVSAEFDDPNDPIEDESWTAVVDIAVDVPAYPDTVAVPVKASIVREIAELAAKNSNSISSRQFVEDATRREIDRLKKSA